MSFSFVDAIAVDGDPLASRHFDGISDGIQRSTVLSDTVICEVPECP
jgi:hypothetical protein